MKIQSKGPISCQFLLRVHEYFLAYSAKYHAVSITRAISPLEVASSNKLIYCTGCVPRFWWPSSLLSLWMFIWHISQRPHCAGLISERSFISKVQAQASTLIRHENGALRFCIDGKHFKNKVFQWRYRQYNNHVNFFAAFSSNTNPNWARVVAFLNFFSVVWTQNV